MAARKTPAQKAAETRKQKQEMSRAKQQVCAIVLFAIGIFLGALSVIEGDNFWRVLHDTLYGLFGFAGILIAPAFIYIAVMATLDKPIGKLGHKVWQSVALIVLVSTAVQIFSYGPLKEQGLWNKIKELFAQGVLLNGGGLVSGLIGQPLVSLCGESGAKVIVVLLIFVFVMIFTGGTLIGLFRGAMKPVQKIGETYTERIQERQSAPDATPPSPGKGRFNVDIPLDGDQPAASRGEPKAAGPFPPAPDMEPSLPWQDAAVPAAAADEGAGAQGSFARKSLERLEQQQEAKATLLGASRPGRFEFDIQLDGDLDDVRTDELPEEPDLEDISQDEVGEDTVLHFRQSAPAAGEDKPQSTDDVINEILRRSANGEEILEGEELPRHGEPEEENAPPEAAKKDPVERKLEAGLSAVSAEVAAKGANERFAEEFGSPKEYAYPPVSLLSEPKRKKDDLDAEELKANAQRLVDTLKSFGVQTRIIDIAKGPAVTR
ncbi:MAG: hypothetical protein DBX66_04650, partial [Clostridiales bacterium]